MVRQGFNFQLRTAKLLLYGSQPGRRGSAFCSGGLSYYFGSQQFSGGRVFHREVILGGGRLWRTQLFSSGGAKLLPHGPHFHGLAI